ncbi:DUF2946 family protein [Luteibacter yeojuensis]|uniref:DUF2946 domain-containing protein n=1 Tax=Luteibacter yeojuensis TaxID=345309 RepID=A0A7X5QW00_9GAMM|nr:DUF2946 family protein [Luteibacter yeojuensis]NID16448.1 DUF2946 domain-containing protein [Luteibacter yeojuensis]
MALVAVWLTVLAPTVSRSLAAFGPTPMPTGMSMPMHHHAMADMPARHDSHGAADCGDACGYCTLFTQLPGMAGSFFVGQALAPASHAPAAAPTCRAGPATCLVYAPARGPPSAQA